MQVSAQSLKIVTKGFADNEVVYIKKYWGRDELVFDSITGNETKEITKSSQSIVTGLYLVVSGNDAAEMVIAGNERIHVEVIKEELKQGKIRLEKSNENEAYERFVSAYLKYDSSFYKTAQSNPDPFNPLFVSRIEEKNRLLQQQQIDFNQELLRLKDQHPGTYTVNVLVPLVTLPLLILGHKNYDYYPSYLFRHFWDNANLNDSLVLSHFLLNEQLKNYFRIFVPKNQDSIKVAIDLVMQKAAGDESVKSHIKNFLLRNFLKANAEDLVLYLDKNNLKEPCELNLSEEEKKKFQRLKSLSVGASAPRLSLPDRNQNRITLQSIAAENRLTLILFWSSHCGLCRAEIPALQKLYEAYKNKGFEVYAVNLDENKFSWREALDKMKLNWINVTDDNPLRSSTVLEQFNIQHTPTIFLVDEKCVIVEKDILGAKLHKAVEFYCSKH